MTATNIDDDPTPVTILTIEPQLAATHVRMSLTIEMAASHTETVIGTRLGDAPCVDVVEPDSRRDGEST